MSSEQKNGMKDDEDESLSVTASMPFKDSTTKSELEKESFSPISGTKENNVPHDAEDGSVLNGTTHHAAVDSQ